MTYIYCFSSLAGQISLLNAKWHEMPKPLQAHEVPLMMLRTSIGVRRIGTPRVGWSDRLISADINSKVRVWEVNEGDSVRRIVITLLAKVCHVAEV